MIQQRLLPVGNGVCDATDTAGFSIPMRSLDSRLNLLNRGRVGGLFDSSLRLSAVLGFGFWGSFLRVFFLIMFIIKPSYSQQRKAVAENE